MAAGHDFAEGTAGSCLNRQNFAITIGKPTGPREGTHLTDPQPAPHHEQKHRAVARPIDHPEQLDEIIFVQRFGKT